MEVPRSGIIGVAQESSSFQGKRGVVTEEATYNGGVSSFLRKYSSVSESNKGPFSEDSLRGAVDQANEIAKMFDRGLKFEYRKEADLYQVSVIDTSRDEVVRKIPPDEVVRFIERIKEMFGAMLDVQA